MLNRFKCVLFFFSHQILLLASCVTLFGLIYLILQMEEQRLVKMKTVTEANDSVGTGLSSIRDHQPAASCISTPGDSM